VMHSQEILEESCQSQIPDTVYSATFAGAHAR